MARLLQPTDAGFAALTGDADTAEPLVFDVADWRLELGSLGMKPGPLKFDPAQCGLDPASIGFVAGWSKTAG